MNGKVGTGLKKDMLESFVVPEVSNNGRILINMCIKRKLCK